VADAIAAAAETRGWRCVRLPLADGGEGTLEALGGANRTTRVTDPLGRPVDAPWRLGDDGVAVVESARASGLALAGGAEGNDPVGATSRGTGELVAAAIEAGARRVLLSLGGSATTDGGLGALEVLDRYAPLDGRDGRAEVLVACDVRTSFVDAAEVFGPQKGATAEQVRFLRERLERLAETYRRRYGTDVVRVEGSGAAGGLGGALTVLGARLVRGFDLVAERLGLAEALRSADAVVTGEGKLDEASFHGKVVGGVLRSAREAGVPVLVVAGAVESAVEGVPCVSLLDRFGADAAWRDPTGCIRRTVEDWLANEWGSA
jgi:glycerate kinase